MPCCVYLSGVVTGYDDDIESADDLYDAIGSMLEGLDSNMEDDTIREICQRLHSTRLKYVLVLRTSSLTRSVGIEMQAYLVDKIQQQQSEMSSE